MKILITGALGHIGSELIRKLNISKKDVVYLVDNLSSGRYCSLFDLPANKRYKFFQMDILSPEIEKLIKKSNIVIHLAAISDAESSVRNPELVNKVNKIGTEKIVKLCSKYGNSLFFPSTTSIYSGFNEAIVDEDCGEENIAPQSPYAESKLTSEKFIKAYAKSHNLKYTIVRFGTIFGYSIGMRFNTAVNKFTYQATTGQPITVWKTALNQRRPYCDLVDCISALNRIINNKIFDNDLYNIVTTNLTVKDIIDSITEYLPKTKITYVDSVVMNKMSYGASRKKAEKNGFIFKGNHKNSIKNMIKILKNSNYLNNL